MDEIDRLMCVWVNETNRLVSFFKLQNQKMTSTVVLMTCRMDEMTGRIGGLEKVINPNARNVEKFTGGKNKGR